MSIINLLCQTIKAKKGPQDRTVINITERYEVEYWSEKFSIPVARLRDIVHKVGALVSAVEVKIGGK